MHNIKDDDGSKELDDEINNEFLCVYFSYQLRMVIWAHLQLMKFKNIIKCICWNKCGLLIQYHVILNAIIHI
jgi:hypothetical protein